MTNEKAWAKILSLPVADRIRLAQCVFCRKDPKTCNGEDDDKGMCKHYTERTVKTNDHS